MYSKHHCFQQQQQQQQHKLKEHPPSRKEMDRRIELEYARQTSRDLSLSRESSTSSISSTSSSSSSKRNIRNSHQNPNNPSSSYPSSTSASNSKSRYNNNPSPPRHSNRLSASLNEAPPLKQEEVLKRFSQLSPESQRRILASKERSVYAEMVARRNLDEDDEDEDDDDEDDDNRRAEEYYVDEEDGDDEMEKRVEEETVFYDSEGRRVKTSPAKPPRPPQPLLTSTKSKQAPPKPGDGLVNRPSWREADDDVARLKKRMMTTTTTTTRPRAPPPPLPAEAGEGAGQKLRLTAVSKGVHKRVKPEEEKR